MSAITLEGKLYMIEQERAFKGEDAVRFLKHLMRQIAGKLLVVWDGSPIHRGGAVKDLDRKSTRLNSSHANISYAVFCLKKKKSTPSANPVSSVLDSLV